MKDNYEYLSSSAYVPSTSFYRKGSGDYNTFQSSKFNSNQSPINQITGYKSKWNTNSQVNGQYGTEIKSQDFSASFANTNEYRDVKRLPEEYSSLRQTFDTRGNNKIKELIAKYDAEENNKNNKNGDKYEKSDNTFYSPKTATKEKYRNYQLQSKLTKYSATAQKINNELQNTNKMSEEIKKLKEDRRKRLQAKQKQTQDYTMSSSYSSVNLGSSYKSPVASSKPAYQQTELKSSYQLNKQSEGFKKRKAYDTSQQVYSQYTPKYEKKIYQEVKDPSTAGVTGSINLDKYKTKVKESTAYASDSKASKYDKEGSSKYDKYDKYQYKPYTTTNIPSSYSSATSSSSSYVSKTTKKLQQPVQYIQINGYILGRTLGQGKFGVVYQATHKATGWLFAIKKVPKSLIKSHLMQDQFVLQLKLQTFLNHENILSIYTQFDDKQAIYIVLEYMEQGTLFAHLKKNKTLPQPEVAAKIKQIASAVKYLHENQIAHRDIKPENIVMSHNVCKLCDFGWATICSDRRKTYCGTFDYAPPEILEGAQYDYTVDLWCLGVLTYELLVGKAPFYHISRKQTMKKILNVEKTNIQYPQILSKNAISFIDNLIKKDPKQRLSSQMLLQHPFLKYADKTATNKH